MDRRHHPHLSRRLIAALLAGALVLAACSSDDDSATDTTSTASTETSEAPTTTVDIEAEEAAGSDDAAAGDDSADSASATNDPSTFFPDVLDAEATQADDGSWTFSVTLSSPYDTPEQYADAWRVVGPDGTVFGIRELLHDHANEQPFTRSQSGIEIPDGITTVTIEGRDQANGWGGATLDLPLGSDPNN